MGVCEPDGLLGLIDAVPQTATGSDLVLPLSHGYAVDCSLAEAPLQWVLTRRPLSGLASELFPRRSGIGLRCGTDLRPSFYGVAVGVTEIPSARCRGWGNSLLSLWHWRVFAMERRYGHQQRRLVG